MSKKYIKVMTQEELDNMEELDDDFELIENEDEVEKVGFFKKHKKGLILGAIAGGIAGLSALITHALDKKHYASDDDYYYDEDDDECVDSEETTED